MLLPRLIATERKMKESTTQLLESIFSVFQGPFGPPLPIKYMFDFIDEQATRVYDSRDDVSNADLAHIWKSNCLPLRFWVNLIKVKKLYFISFEKFLWYRFYQ